MPVEFIVFLTAMAPLGELRVSIPLGLMRYALPAWEVYLLSVAGTLFPMPVLLTVLSKIGAYVEGMKNPLGSLFRWRTQQVTNRYRHVINRFGFWAIVILVAIPLPMTGAWSGALAIWGLRLPLSRGVAGIALGTCIAGLIITMLSLGSIKIIFD